MKKLLSFALLAMFILASCGGSGSKNEAALEGKDFLVTIKTDFGEMKAILFDDTPQHKENFLKLAKDGFFDSLLFHRVMSNFMIQGGDPNSKNAPSGMPLGSGGPGYTVPAEFVSTHFHKKGALSAARQPDAVNPQKASSGSQFFIVQGQVIPSENISIDMQALGMAVRKIGMEQSDGELNQTLENAYNTGGSQAYQDKAIELIDEIAEATGMTLRKEVDQEKLDAYTTIGGYPPLDGDYTVFGEVIDGLDVIDKIAAVQTQPDNRPIEDVRMFVSVEEMSKKEIKEKFGYTYQ